MERQSPPSEKEPAVCGMCSSIIYDSLGAVVSSGASLSLLFSRFQVTSQ